MTPEQLKEIDDMLGSGIAPDVVARSLGLQRRSQLIYKLLRAGRQIQTVRRLVPTGPIADVSATNDTQPKMSA